MKLTATISAYASALGLMLVENATLIGVLIGIATFAVNTVFRYLEYRRKVRECAQK